VDIRPEVEEVCNWWAQIIGSDFANQPLVRKNFTASFLDLFDSSLGASSLEDFDFTQIKEHLEKIREDKKNRPIDERKKEAAEKAEHDAKFKFCLFNNKVEKVSNFVVEPPGIFRGRGEHPHAGCLKSRIVPENVVLNIG